MAKVREIGYQGEGAPDGAAGPHHVDIITVNSVFCDRFEKGAREAAGVTMTQYRVLLRVVCSAEPLPVSEIASSLCMNQSTISTAISKLEAEQMVRRIESEDDRRSALVDLTDEGMNAIALIDERNREIVIEFLKMLDGDERKLAAIESNRGIIRWGLSRIENNQLRLDTAISEYIFLIRSQIARGLKTCGFSSVQYRLLLILAACEDGLRVIDAADRILVRSNEITMAANALEDRALVTRIRDCGDRRVSYLVATEEGRQAAAEASSVVAGYIRHTSVTCGEFVQTHEEVCHRIVESWRASARGYINR